MHRAALLFDLDGTMLHTDPLHFAVFVEMMAPYGVLVDEAFYMARVHGRLNKEVFAELLPQERDLQALSDAKEAEFRRRLPHPFPPMPGLRAVLDTAQAAGHALAVVTNANRNNATVMLAAIGESDRFETIISGGECARAKPFPDPYLAAMAALKVRAQDSIAFEDSPAGVRSARAAGALVIGLRSSKSDSDLRDAGAHHTISDFTDPALGPLLARSTGVSA